MNGYVTYLASQGDEGRYKLLVDNITDYAIYMLDPQGFVMSWNAGAERFKGYAAHEIIGEHFSKFYTPEDRATGLPDRALETARTHGKFEHIGWRLRKDGTRFWANVIIDPVRDLDGNLVGYAKITRDLTERKRAEEILKASEQQFRLLVQSVTDYAIYMLDPDGFVANWNSGAERIKGYRADEIVGRHFSTFYTPEDREAGLPQMALETCAREGRFLKEGWRVRKDGTRFWASVVLDAIRSETGTLLGFAKVTRDITERVEAERALEQTREALFQSQKLEAIGQLTGGVAHDFNNLLSAALGSLELIQKRLPNNDARLQALVQNASAALSRGAALTQRMLAFARRQDLKLQSVAVREVIDSMCELIQRSLGPSISLHNRVPSSLPDVRADANQIEMALLNLAMNARDAMPNGGTIVVDARKVSLPGKGQDFICLSVTDDGVGMDEATLKRAMEPFFTTKGVGKGTGLGLSMVKGLAEQSGGHFDLHSVRGQGTRAELFLPIATDMQDEAMLSSDAADVTEKSAMRILAVDDDPLVLLNTVSMLEDLGHQVVEAPSGPKALEILDGGERFDLLVTDQAMPHMTGLTLLQTVRDKWPETRLKTPKTLTQKAHLQKDLRRRIFRSPMTPSPTTRVLLALQLKSQRARSRGKSSFAG